MNEISTMNGGRFFMNEEVKELVEQIHKLNKHLDERVKTIEERQSKTETKISQGGPVAAEARAELNKINDAISNEIKEYRKLVLEQKEAMLAMRSEEHTSELQSHSDLVCRLLLEKKKKTP